jgi:hypothetical protein
MHRRDFIKKSCTACLSVSAISLLASSCVSTRYTPGKIVKDGISLLKEDFIIRQKGGKAYSSFIIVRNDALKFPICVYRTATMNTQPSGCAVRIRVLNYRLQAMCCNVRHTEASLPAKEP